MKATTNPKSPAYNREAVQREIERSRRRNRVSGTEAKLIHALLKGRSND